MSPTLRKMLASLTVAFVSIFGANSYANSCVAGWLKIGEALVSAGLARHMSIQWQGNKPILIQSAISPEGCSAFLVEVERLTLAGCNIDREVELAREASYQSESQYRHCQKRFPDTWDRMCLSYFRNDQQKGDQLVRILHVKGWIENCKPPT